MRKFTPFFIAALFAAGLGFAVTPHSTPSRGPLAYGVYYHDGSRLAPADTGAVDDLRRQTGRLPAAFMIYQSWTGSYAGFPWKEAKGAREFGKPLSICWEPWAGQNGAAAWSCRSVANGRYDAYVTRYARQAKAFRAPIMIRLAHEMNGDWYPWGTAYTGSSARNNGNRPEDYVAMWRHVVDIFRREGAQNVAWVWSPNVYYLNASNSERSQISDLQTLFPGDAYVDWVGFSVFNDGSQRPWRKFSDLLSGAYSVVTALTAKPVMIAEMGVTEQGAPHGTSKADWIRETLTQEIPASFPRIRMITWFCRDKSSFGEADYRFSSSRPALAAFRAAVNSPLYQGELVNRKR